MSEIRLTSKSQWPVAFALSAGSLCAACSIEPDAVVSGDQLLSGRAIVIDGDTLDIGATRIRLEGIDAPEASQTCQSSSGRSWPCGRSATQALARLIDGSEVTCTRQGTDKYDRMLGLCSARDKDLNQAMVRSGMARAFVKYSMRYILDEERAQASKIGIWQGPSEAPWEFRKNRWQTAESAAPAGCAIKGNVSTKGRIYHMPWSPWYGKVSINAKQGERWFCSETEAQQAGWRAAQGA